jgi:hypothetical protein
MSVLYSSVGQAGGSGYLAVMAYLGVAPEVMRPTALVLNVLVAGIATFRLLGSRHLRPSLICPLLMGSVPSAVVGGALDLPRSVYNPLVGVVLLLAAVPLIRSRKVGTDLAPHQRAGVPLPLALVAGAGIGLLAGLTGTGGGIFLSPLLLLLGWAGAQEMRATSTVFILINSVAALLANVASVGSLPGALPLWGAAALVGGLIGAELGTHWLSTKTVLRILAVVLITGGLKLIVTP